MSGDDIDLSGCIEATISNRVPGFPDSLTSTSAIDIRRGAAEATIAEQLRTAPIVAEREITITTYDAKRAVSLIEQVSEPEPAQPDELVTERVVGWEIRPRSTPGA